MSRKDFELIAATIRSLRDDFVRAYVARAFAGQLRTTNPDFDKARFLKACGVADG
jgi:hypothetical protein